MKKNKEKAVKSHRGRGKEITGKRVSEEGEKTSLLSMHMSDIGSTLKGSGHNNTENPADWDTRANLLPRSIVILNRDRAIKYLLTYVLIFVIAIAVIISVFMGLQSSWADHRVNVAQQKTLSLQQEKAQFKDVEATLNSLDDSQKAKISMLYDEMDWMQVANSLNGALPEGGQYTSLELKSYQLSDSDSSSSSSSSDTATVWSGNGVVTVDFSIVSPNFISAKDFIANFAGIPTYQTGYVKSITKDSKEGGTTYTYEGTVSLKMDGNTTSRSDNSAGVDKEDRALLEKLRKSLTKAAQGTSEADQQASSSSSTSSSNGSSN